MNFECHPCGISEGLSHHQEDESIDINIFSSSVRLLDRIKKLVLPNFMGVVRSVSVIFDTGAT